MTTYLDIWTKSESAAEDAITVKRVYIDICGGNLIDGVLFSQIMYWHGIGKNGQRRLKVFKDGYWWLAKKYEDWESECRINARTARAAITRMCKIGLLEKKTYHFGGVPIAHIRIVPEKFQELIEASMDNKSSLMCQEMSDASDIKCQNHVSGNVTSYTEITTETTKDSFADPDGSASRQSEPKKRRIPATLMNPMKNAIVAAFKWDAETMNKDEWGIVLKAARGLCESGVEITEVGDLYRYCKVNFGSFGPNALATNVQKWRATLRRKPPRPTVAPLTEEEKAAIRDEMFSGPNVPRLETTQ